MDKTIINKLCYRKEDREIVEQLMETPAVLGYSCAEDWICKGLSRKASENMASLVSICNNMIRITPTKISNALDAVNIVHHMLTKDTESICVIILNNGNKILYAGKLNDGGFTGVTIDIKIILRKCIAYGGTGIILAHNHPSGNTYPSDQDIQLTRNVAKASEILNIRMVDHVIVTYDKSNYYSFHEKGLL